MHRYSVLISEQLYFNLSILVVHHHPRKARQYHDNKSPNSTWLVSTRLDTTRHVRRVEPMHFGCVELVEQHSSTGSTRRTRLARHVELNWLDRLDTTSSTGATCNLIMINVIYLLFNLSYSLIYWSIHLFNLFDLAEQIGFVCVCEEK